MHYMVTVEAPLSDGSKMVFVHTDEGSIEEARHAAETFKEHYYAEEGVVIRIGELLETIQVDPNKGDPLNVPARLASFKDIKAGWLNGDGAALDDDGLDWLSETFTAHYPDDVLLPYTYPTEDGNVQMEWQGKCGSILLHIDLNKRRGDLLTPDTDMELDMNSKEGWFALAEEVRKLKRK